MFDNVGTKDTGVYYTNFYNEHNKTPPESNFIKKCFCNFCKK